MEGIMLPFYDGRLSENFSGEKWIQKMDTCSSCALYMSIDSSNASIAPDYETNKETINGYS
jgi:hypothetical protein